ncbi:MAG: hypothetical protein HYS41_04815 [Candidatus Omnitrophica bacterium]|nr:hypothetical protein [Candidatus Omnitrophota bacterium]
MHPYSTDSKERIFVPFFLAVLSILGALLFHKWLAFLRIELPWWSEAPSVMGVYGLFHGFFDRAAWRWPILRKIGIVKIPDLNGSWKGEAGSSFDRHSSGREITVEIQQRWSRISVVLRAPDSISRSLIGGLLTEDPIGAMLSYEYLNEPKSNAPATMQTHRGTTRLIIGENLRTLEGEYYSGRGRSSAGVLNLKRITRDGRV